MGLLRLVHKNNLKSSLYYNDFSPILIIFTSFILRIYLSIIGLKLSIKYSELVFIIIHLPNPNPNSINFINSWSDSFIIYTFYIPP